MRYASDMLLDCVHVVSQLKGCVIVSCLVGRNLNPGMTDGVACYVVHNRIVCWHDCVLLLMWCCCPLQDFSDLVAQKAAQQKRKAAQAKESGKAKKQKSDNFKF